MKKILCIMGFALGTLGITVFVVIGVAEGIWWRLLALLTLWPMGLGFMAIWRGNRDIGGA